MNPLEPPPKTGGEFLQRVRESGGMTSGGAVPEDFVDGWATHPFRGAFKAHYWRAERPRWLPEGVLFQIKSACGIDTIATKQVPLLGAGTFPTCGRCDVSMLAYMRRTKKAIARLR